MKKSIGILVSNYICDYLYFLCDLCNKNDIEIDLFFFNEYNPKFKYRKKYILNTKYNSKKKYKSKHLIEQEIIKITNIDEYDYFVSDCICLSFKNACNIFHEHTTNYKNENTTKGILKIIRKICHLYKIKKDSEYYKNTKLCIVGSTDMKQDINKNCNIPFKNIKIIYPGFNSLVYPTNFHDKIEVFENTFVIGSVTCGFYLKGGYTILNALKELKKEYTPEQLKCKFINPNYNRQWQLKLYIKFLGLDKYVEFLPYYKNISNFYNQLNCLICASKSEAFGRVVPEAMISNVPVIVASNVGSSEIIKNEINGYIFVNDDNKTKNLVKSIKKVIKSKNINTELIENAKNTASNISWKNFSEQLFNAMFSKI